MKAGNHSIFHIGQLILFLFVSNLLFVTSCFVFGISISKCSLPFSIAIAIVLFFVVNAYPLKGKYIADCLLFIAVLFICAYIFGKLYSNDYDGNAYHKMAVGLLKNGWNPLKMSAEDFLQKLFPGSFLQAHALWCDHYGKASWIFAASIYAVTGNIESGKAYNILAIICLFCFLYSYLESKNYSFWKRVVLCLIASGNPIALGQISTYYIDGFLGSMLFVLIIALTQDVDFQSFFYGRRSKAAIVSAFAVCGNIKFTGLLYGTVFGIAYLILYAIYITAEKKEKWFLVFWKRGVVYGIFALVTVVWAGAPVYIQNFLQHGSFTYPLTGEGKVDIMTAHSPTGFLDISGPQRLFYSLFAHNSDMTSSLPRLKIPFTFTKEEIGSFCEGWTIDLRISGFGVFFSGILLICIAIIIISMIKIWKIGKKFLFYYFFINILMVVLLSVFISESWWARYSPYIYLLVVFGGVFLLKEADKRKRLWFDIVCGVFFIIIEANNCLFLGQLGMAIKNSPQIEQSFQELKGQPGTQIMLVNSDFSGLIFNLEDKVDDFVLVPEESNLEGEALYYGYLKVLNR